uniref:Uncharacterized protein n=1 Tax=Anguilla anguilla TaxID=7936 RepID=A0A0E9WYG8_ANGAN
MHKVPFRKEWRKGPFLSNESLHTVTLLSICTEGGGPILSLHLLHKGKVSLQDQALLNLMHNKFRTG